MLSEFGGAGGIPALKPAFAMARFHLACNSGKSAAERAATPRKAFPQPQLLPFAQLAALDRHLAAVAICLSRDARQRNSAIARVGGST
jgi:hypothetical protein